MLLDAEIVEDLESLLLQPQAETQAEAEAQAQVEAETQAATEAQGETQAEAETQGEAQGETQGEAQAGTTATCSSSRLAAEATRVETQALEIMRVGYGGFDSYSE